MKYYNRYKFSLRHSFVSDKADKYEKKFNGKFIHVDLYIRAFVDE